MEPKIPGGYIFLSRKIIDSAIWGKPPLYLKVWVYLLSKAQHTDYKQLKRGQLVTSIPEIIKACSWHVGYRLESPSYKEVRSVIEWLKDPVGNISRNPYEGITKGNMKGSMIGTTKGTHGLLVTIDKYDYYQTPENYEGQHEGQDEGNTKDERRETEGHNINKNDKNDTRMNKNDNKIYIPYREIIDYLNLKAGTSYKATSKKTQTLIHARCAEGFSLDDFKTVIDKKITEWKGTEFEKFIRPETLFGTKFESYLNQKEGQPKTNFRAPKTTFNSFDQRTYDMKDLEKKLLGRDGEDDGG